MCTIIEADCILANLFAAGYTTVAIRDLKEARAAVEEIIDGVFVNVSLQAVLEAVEIWPDMFEWRDREVVRPAGSDPGLFTISYVDDLFNWRIPKNQRLLVRGALAGIRHLDGVH